MIVTGSPTQAVVDGVRSALLADATLARLVTGVYGHLPAARVTFPYLVIGRRTRQNDRGAMQSTGGRISLQLDVWSAHKGPSEAHAILSAVTQVLERRNVTVSGFALVQGSLTCETEDVFDEPDEDSPERVLYHGVQRWTCEVHEV